MGTPAPDAVKRLVDLSACNAQADRFDQNRKVYRSSDYKEEQLRAEFLNPFFTALGGDMDNKQGPSEFSVIADSVHRSWSIVPGTEDRKPGTKNREPETNIVIRLTAGHQAKVEEKPEVRKAGGVRYTPQYIVNCIIKNTVGKLLEGCPPARWTSARRRSKMLPMSAQGRATLTGMEMFVMSPETSQEHMNVRIEC